MVVDKCTGVEYLNNIKDSVVFGFQYASKEGVLTNENMRGISFDVYHVVLHPKASFRGPTQIVPTTKRAIYAAQLTTKPRLLEPVYLVEIQSPESYLVGICSELNQSALWDSTNGEAYPQCVFDHWDMMSSDPLDAVCEAGALVATIRVGFDRLQPRY
nr:elongation factor 2-like [Tanacetum cinerariifolium]